jgi:hypothetical protein
VALQDYRKSNKTLPIKPSKFDEHVYTSMTDEQLENLKRVLDEQSTDYRSREQSHQRRFQTVARERTGTDMLYYGLPLGLVPLDQTPSAYRTPQKTHHHHNPHQVLQTYMPQHHKFVTSTLLDAATDEPQQPMTHSISKLSVLDR